MMEPKGVAVARLGMGHTPAEMAASLERDFGLSLNWNLKTMFPVNGQSYVVPHGVTVTGTEEAKAAALRAMDQLSKAASPADLIRALTEVSAITAKKADGDAVNDVMLRAMALRLEEYPADVAIRAVRSWPDKSKWFPTWCEIKAECEGLMGARRAFRCALAMDKMRVDSPEMFVQREKSDSVARDFRMLANSLRGA